MRTDPPVSDPNPIGTILDETATAVPLLEPPGVVIMGVIKAGDTAKPTKEKAKRSHPATAQLSRRSLRQSNIRTVNRK